MSQHLFEAVNDRLLVSSLTQWAPQISPGLAQTITSALEAGKVVYLPRLAFCLDAEEQALLTLPLQPKKAKNISYDPKKQRVGGLDNPIAAVTVAAMLQRYHRFSTQLLAACCPYYQAAECSGRTSFRPVEIKDRKPVSYRKDDTRLHVDAFPSTPVNNLRILRVFTNINPFGEDRLWRLGQPFAEVMQRFLPSVRSMLPLEAEILYRLKATRRKRTHYDHYMLQIHNAMKADLDYQRRVDAFSMAFPPGSTWMVYTDLVSHAALAGRFVLEQTYYPAIERMLNPQLAPQSQMQQSALSLGISRRICSPVA